MDLKEKLYKYDEAYYNGIPLISDEEYDTLKAEYLNSINKVEYDYVPGAGNGRIPHTAPVLSLAKVKITDQESLRKELERLWPVCIQWKLDGMTLVEYENNSLITRGDGYYGEDKSFALSYIKGLGTYPGYPVRGEGVITKEDFRRLNELMISKNKEPFKNARNAISGLLNRKLKDDEKYLLSYITFISYNLLNTEQDEMTQIFTLKEENGYECVNTVCPKTIDTAIEYINSFEKNSTSIDIDGLVIKHIGDKKFGKTGHHPQNAFAVKFETPSIWTKLKTIEWQVGGTGQVTPVAIFNPIDLLGSTVEKATLHNAGRVEELGLDKIHEYDVLVTKANDIIPVILKAKKIKDFSNIISSIPTRCPICDIELKREKDILYCNNPFCKEKIIQQATNLASRECLDIKGLSEETIRKMYESKYAWKTTLDFPFFILGNWTKELLLTLDGFAEKSAIKLCNEIKDKTKKVLFSKFLASCQIPLLGKSTAKLIAKNFSSLKELENDIMDNDSNKLLSINGIGNELCINLENKWQNITILNSYIKEIDYSEYKPQTTKNQLVFVITGTLDKPRSYYQKLIEDSGHKVSNAISSKTNYLLAGKDCGSKLEKAIAKKIQILNSEKQLLEILEKEIANE